jgi:hypothetical protein
MDETVIVGCSESRSPVVIFIEMVTRGQSENSEPEPRPDEGGQGLTIVGSAMFAWG